MGGKDKFLLMSRKRSGQIYNSDGWNGTSNLRFHQTNTPQLLSNLQIGDC